MCIGMCIDMCIDMCMDMCIDMCVDMRADTCRAWRHTSTPRKVCFKKKKGGTRLRPRGGQACRRRCRYGSTAELCAPELGSFLRPDNGHWRHFAARPSCQPRSLFVKNRVYLYSKAAGPVAAFKTYPKVPLLHPLAPKTYPRVSASWDKLILPWPLTYRRSW